MIEQDVAPINGALLRRQREARGWSLSDMATRACMSIKQIRQIEDGGLSAFYSEAVKQTAARKVGAILDISPEAVFGYEVVAPVTELSFVTAHEAAELLALSESDASESAEAEQPQATQLDAAPSLNPETVSTGVPPSAAEPAQDAPVSVRTKNSWGLIAVLFVGAIALAASMRPHQEPSAAAEPPPALAPALQGGPAEPAVTSTADNGTTAPAETAAVVAPVSAASQTAPAPAGGGAASSAKSN